MLTSFKARVRSIIRRLKIGRLWDGCTLKEVCEWGFYMGEGTERPEDAPPGVWRLVVGVGLRGILYDLAQPARLRDDLAEVRRTRQPDRERELLAEIESAEARAAEARRFWDLPSDLSDAELLDRLRAIGREQGLSPDELLVVEPCPPSNFQID